MPRPVFDHFGRIAPYYDRLIQPHGFEKLISLLELPVRGALLDAGGGTGRVSQALRGLAGTVVVADETAGMLAQAAPKKGLHCVQTHAESLPFPGECFERIIMIDALHHVADQQASAGELWRVLKPGGRLVIEEPNIETFGVKLIALGEKLALMRTRIIPPDRIVALFSPQRCPAAQVRVIRDGYLVWVVVEKKNIEQAK